MAVAKIRRPARIPDELREYTINDRACRSAKACRNRKDCSEDGRPSEVSVPCGSGDA